MLKSPLHFCLITTFYPPYHFGGDGVFVYALANELAKLGNRVDVIHCLDAFRLLYRKQPTENYPNHPNVTVHTLHSRLGWMSPVATQQTGYPLFKLRRIRKILAQPFDVIHYHNVSLVGGPKILSYGQGIKLYTMHEYWLTCPTHVLFRLNETICTEKKNCIACSLAFKRPPQLWRYTRLLNSCLKHVDAFIAISRFSRDIHKSIDPSLPIVQLPSFIPDVDVTASFDNQIGVAQAKPYFLFVGRLEKLKGPQTLIPVFRHYPKANLLIVGRGSSEPQLRALAAGCSNIKFLGFQSGGQLRALYRTAVATIVPSICPEVLPLVAVESLREQTPVIVRNLGGLPEIIADSGAGFTFDNETELTHAMDRLLEDDSLRQQLGVLGLQSYRRNWTAKAHLNRYFALIQELMADKKRKSIHHPERPNTH